MSISGNCDIKIAQTKCGIHSEYTKIVCLSTETFNIMKCVIISYSIIGYVPHLPNEQRYWLSVQFPCTSILLKARDHNHTVFLCAPSHVFHLLTTSRQGSSTSCMHDTTYIDSLTHLISQLNILTQT